MSEHIASIPEDEQQEIQAAPTLRRYRIEIPNLYDDLDLGVYEFRLLVHYIRRGECWESTRTTAQLCKMSTGKVSQARQVLWEKGLITIEENEHGTMTIRVVDVWDENFIQYGQHSTRGQKKEPYKNKDTSSSLTTVDLLDEAYGSVCRYWQTNIGSLTGILVFEIRKIVEELGPERTSWFIQAIDEAIKANVRNWNYIRAILRRSIDQGLPPGVRTNEQTSSAHSGKESQGERFLRIMGNGDT